MLRAGDACRFGAIVAATGTEATAGSAAGGAAEGTTAGWTADPTLLGVLCTRRLRGPAEAPLIACAADPLVTDETLEEDAAGVAATAPLPVPAAGVGATGVGVPVAGGTDAVGDDEEGGTEEGGGVALGAGNPGVAGVPNEGEPHAHATLATASAAEQADSTTIRFRRLCRPTAHHPRIDRAVTGGPYQSYRRRATSETGSLRRSIFASAACARRSQLSAGVES